MEKRLKQSERIPVPSSLEERKPNSELRPIEKPNKKEVSGIRAAIWAASKIERKLRFPFLGS